jgi:hypothetical protein
MSSFTAVLLGSRLHAVLPGDDGSTYSSSGLALSRAFSCAELRRDSDWLSPPPFAGVEAGSLAELGLLSRVAASGAAVLDACCFVQTTAVKPAADLAAAVENLLLDCTAAELPRNCVPTALSSAATTKTGCSGLLVLRECSLPPLFAGAPSLQDVASRAILPPDLSLFSPATSALFSLPGLGSPHPSGSPRLAAGHEAAECSSGTCSTVRVAVVHGSSLLVCLRTQQHCWCRFDRSVASGRWCQSACSCGAADRGVLWCEHCRAAAQALSGGRGGQEVAVVDLNVLRALLATLSTTHLAQLLLQLALLTQRIPEVLQALELDPSRVFLTSLAGLPLAVPGRERAAAAARAPGASLGLPGISQSSIPLPDLLPMLDPLGIHQSLEQKVMLPKGSGHGVGKLGPLAQQRFGGLLARHGSIADAVHAELSPRRPEDELAVDPGE